MNNLTNLRLNDLSDLTPAQFAPGSKLNSSTLDQRRKRQDCGDERGEYRE